VGALLPDQDAGIVLRRFPDVALQRQHHLRQPFIG
jgi:hypothetical protein